jgi:hypothetical protein
LHRRKEGWLRHQENVAQQPNAKRKRDSAQPQGKDAAGVVFRCLLNRKTTPVALILDSFTPAPWFLRCWPITGHRGSNDKPMTCSGTKLNDEFAFSCDAPGCGSKPAGAGGNLLTRQSRFTLLRT